MSNLRPVGVRVPENQSTEQAPTMVVTNFTRLEIALVEYGDERGRKVTTVAFISGDKAFIPPQGEQWTAGFRSFAKKISEQIIEKNELHQSRSTHTAPVVPTSDSVSILGSIPSEPGPSDDELAARAEESLRKGNRR